MVERYPTYVARFVKQALRFLQYKKTRAAGGTVPRCSLRAGSDSVMICTLYMELQPAIPRQSNASFFQGKRVLPNHRPRLSALDQTAFRNGWPYLSKGRWSFGEIAVSFTTPASTI
jgi:hypothetical protein